jgi:hypothetical protein
MHAQWKWYSAVGLLLFPSGGRHQQSFDCSSCCVECFEKVLRALEDDVALPDLHQGVKPGYSHAYASSYASTEFDSSCYILDVKERRQTHQEGPDYSSEYSGGAGSEYGANPLTSSGEH